MIKVLLKSVIIVSVLLTCGCDHMGVDKSACPEDPAELGVYSGYTPAEINILPLTKIEAGDKGSMAIRAYVSLMDGFGSQIKMPGQFRFELYEKVARSSEPKGKRVVMWPDFDLQTPGDNNRHWQDFLRTYKFDLDFQSQKGRHYVLQVTYMCPSGKRLAAETNLAVE